MGPLRDSGAENEVYKDYKGTVMTVSLFVRVITGLTMKKLHIYSLFSKFDYIYMVFWPDNVWDAGL